MKYFLHDTSSFDDEKISMLFHEFGYEGLGLFYTLLERIAKQEKPINTIVLKKQLRVGKKLEKCWLYMEEIELISSQNGQTFNEKLLKYSEKYQIKKEKNRERISQWRENHGSAKNVTRNEQNSISDKLNESKVNEIKEKETEAKPSDFLPLVGTVVGDMFFSWKKNNPESFVDPAEYKPLHEIGKKIASWVGADIDSPDGKKTILQRWEEVLSKIKSDSHLSKYSITQIDKHFSSITQTFVNGAKVIKRTNVKPIPEQVAPGSFGQL